MHPDGTHSYISISTFTCVANTSDRACVWVTCCLKTSARRCGLHALHQGPLQMKFQLGDCRFDIFKPSPHQRHRRSPEGVAGRLVFVSALCWDIPWTRTDWARFKGGFLGSAWFHHGLFHERDPNVMLKKTLKLNSVFFSRAWTERWMDGIKWNACCGEIRLVWWRTGFSH